MFFKNKVVSSVSFFAILCTFCADSAFAQWYDIHGTGGFVYDKTKLTSQIIRYSGYLSLSTNAYTTNYVNWTPTIPRNTNVDSVSIAYVTGIADTIRNISVYNGNILMRSINCNLNSTVFHTYAFGFLPFSCNKGLNIRVTIYSPATPNSHYFRFMTASYHKGGYIIFTPVDEGRPDEDSVGVRLLEDGRD